MANIKKRIKAVLRTLWEYRYSMTAITLIVCIILSGIHYLKSGDVASATISFNYSEASNGLNPNNTRFNSYEILSDEVLQDAIERVGLQDTLTVEELSDCVQVSPVDTGNSSGSDDYISTTYAITLDAAPLELRNRTTMSLLENICSAYKSSFLKKNGDNQKILKLDLEITQNAEPYLRLNEIKVRANQLQRYLSARMGQRRAFSDSETGRSFDEFDKRLANIISYDIPNTMAFIIECGVARDSSTLTEILEYKAQMEKLSADEQMAYYEADNAGIAMYEKLMSSIVMIPTMDEMDQYYMSRTKTAMDKMARSADSELADATSHKKEIVSLRYVIEKINEDEKSEAALATACEMINRLETGLNELARELIVFDRTYIEYKAQDYITFFFNTQSFLQRINVKMTICEVAVLVALVMIRLYVQELRKEQKDRKKGAEGK